MMNNLINRTISIKSIYFLTNFLTCFTLVSCREDIGIGSNAMQQGNPISFTAEADTVLWNSSYDRTNSKSRICLGYIENDSFYVSIEENDNSIYLFQNEDDTLKSKTRGVFEEDLECFYINACLDNAKPYISKQLVTDNGGEWEYSPLSYWPDNNKLNFFAYSWNGNLDDNLIQPVFLQENGNFVVTFSYSSPQRESNSNEGDAALQKDIMFAIALNQTYLNNPVKLKFQHALAAIRFKLGEIPEDIKIKSIDITLSGLYNSGICKIVQGEDKTVKTQWIPDIDNGKTSYKESFIKDTSVPFDEYELISTTEKTFLMIPQNIKDNEEAQLDIVLRIGNKDYHFSKSLKEFNIDWAANKVYTYTIAIGEDSRQVAIEIDDVCETNVKKDVSIQNTGLATTYLRVAIVGYWAIKDETGREEIIEPWDIETSDVGMLTKHVDWDNFWVKGDDGFYYYKKALPPGEYTGVPLFDTYKLNQITGPLGSKLVINIIVQAIDASDEDKVLEYWPDIQAEFRQ